MNGSLKEFRLDERLAVITGGASGIGFATAQLFASAGARVVLLDHDADAVERATIELPESTGYCLDISDEDGVPRAFERVASDQGPIDVLVNSAGMALRHPALDISIGDWNRVIAVNLTGTFLCAREAARHMPERGGAIVNVASIMGLSGGGLYPNISYQTSKGGVVNMTRALAVEWAPRKIRVNAVAPTWTRTAFIGALESSPELMSRIHALTPMGRLAETDEVARAILFLASDAASMVTGHILPVDGGFLAQ